MKRPLGVTAPALVFLLYGLLMTGLNLFGLVLTVLHHNSTVPPELAAVVGRWSGSDLLALTAQLTLGVFALVGGVGLLRPWAWLLGMLLLGCELTIQLGGYFHGRPAYMGMFVTAFRVFTIGRRNSGSFTGAAVKIAGRKSSSFVLV